MNRGPDTPEVVLRLRGVCKRYGSITTVSNLDLDVHDAEVMALLGPNGAGKTTTVEMCEASSARTPAALRYLDWTRSPTTHACAHASA